jgi:hypothetical protein
VQENIKRCTKSRFGGNFRVEVAFWPNIGKMVDITPIKGDYFNGHDDDFTEEKLRELMKETETEPENVG